MNYWLIKSEPSAYSWDQFEKDGIAQWDGVRNYAARNNLRSMKKGDLAFYYHSNEGLEIVGIAKVDKEHFQDPTTDNPNWLAVIFKPFKKLKNPVSLSQIKNDPELKDIQLVKLSRLSVASIKREEFDYILELSTLKKKNI